jgi:AcrR family transcriptional regulator
MNDSQSVAELPRRGTEERRQQLLDVARRRFVNDGYSGTSVSAIVRDAGVAQGTFYVYFGSKQALLAELRREVFRDYAQALRKVAEGPGEADERLVSVIVEMVHVVHRNVELERVFRQAESAQDLELTALQGRGKLAQMASALLVEGLGGHSMEVENPLLVAQLLVTLFDNVLFESLAYQRPANVVDTVMASLRLVLRGVGVTEMRLASLLSTVPGRLP